MTTGRIIISIGRECGSGGHEIGEKLARHYGIKFYDANLIDELVKGEGLDADKLHSIEEKVTGNILPAHKGGFPQDKKVLMDKMSKSDRLYLMEKGLIEKMAKEESFVIVGRAANAILKDNEDTLRLYVYAREGFKIPRVKEYYHIKTDADAKKEMLKIDKARREYFNYYTGQTWGSSDVHDFMIDSSLFGIDQTVDIITKLADRKFAMQKVS